MVTRSLPTKPRSTDCTDKRETYAEYSVGEYWRFDHSGGEYHDAPLAGDRLVIGELVRYRCPGT
ncbi:MAG: hypothetical protein F4Y49_12610 [Dehalococcoidia bacterium]|nr:hypothetical protein [Dehalococcoidia bacterium]